MQFCLVFLEIWAAEHFVCRVPYVVGIHIFIPGLANEESHMNTFGEIIRSDAALVEIDERNL